MLAVHRLAQCVTGLFSLFILWLAWQGLHSPAPGATLASYAIIPHTPLDLTLALTPFSGLFLGMLGLAGVLAGLYGAGYGHEYRERRYGLALDLELLVFLGAMTVVFTAANVFTFMTGWEVMSISSYLLVVHDSHKPGVVQSGLIYLVMTQIGSAFLLVAFLLLHQGTGSYDFGTFARLAHTLSPGLQSVIFLCALVGLLLKAGIMPLHVWLPRAHPVAPSHISALMSGVMIKTALYGFLLVSVSWLQGMQVGWGLLTVILGGASAVLGAQLAGQETGLKRSLAYSSIDNMGLTLLLAGVSLTAMALHQPAWAGFALAAALFHAWNHALFKSVLFQGAGAVLYTAHTDELNKLGGLLRRMPWSGLFFLVALLSLASLPPWGGFASEWMMFSALAQIASAHRHTWFGLVAAAGVLALLLTGALTLLAALRLFGIGFLAEPRSDQAARAREVPLSMRVSLGIGALFTLFSGLGSGWLVTRIGRALPGGLSFSPGGSSGYGWTTLPGRAMLMLGGAILIGACAAWLVARLAGGRPRISVVPTWTCGGQRTPSMSYSATGLSQPVRRAWRMVNRPLAIHYLYRPVWGGVMQTTTVFRRIQNGHVRSYLVYLFATVLLLLAVAH